TLLKMLMFFSTSFQALEAVQEARRGGWQNTMPFHKMPAISGLFLWNDTARDRFALLRSKKRLS
ncbi:MAG: hypothetical protein Q8M91_05430, partial [Polaromonas sp.]|nr:hypothetical protein [Polaromonas sp.]